MAAKAELAGIVGDVVSYFQIKPPSDKTIDLWLKKLEGMNLLASRARIVDIITNGDTPPRNFPGAVKQAYSTWLRDQPREYQGAGCSKCLGGRLHAVKDGNSYVFKCGHCNTLQANYPMATRYSLAERGFRLDWAHDYGGPVDQETAENIKRLTREPEVDRRQESEPMELPF